MPPRLGSDGSPPRVSEAWVVGSRNTPIDRSPARELSDIAIVFDPPLPDDDEERADALMDLMRMLDAKGHGRGTGRSWLILSPEIIAAHREHATLIYSRFSQTA
jgi:hypothetical protein